MWWKYRLITEKLKFSTVLGEKQNETIISWVSIHGICLYDKRKGKK